jgi:F0F1-type ATP synthase assembly protein I
MKKSQRVGLWALAAALLAGTEFGYAHLRQVDLWPLQLIVSTLWRVFEQQAASTSENHLALGCLGLLLMGLMVEVLSLLRKRRPVVEESPGDGDE